MVERRRPRGWGGASGNGAGESGGAGDYKVGRGKPPLHSRFVPGQSGNPKGRRKGSRNLKTDVRRALAVPVKMRVSNRIQTCSTQEAALMILREKALQGNERAIEKLLELARHHNNDELEAASQPLAEEDQAILAAFVAQTVAPDPSIEMDEDDLSPDAPTQK